LTLAYNRDNLKTVAQNKKAFLDYFIDEAFEAGIELFGTEVKSIRQGKISLKESWCEVEKGQMIVKGMHISPYEMGNIFNKDPLRPKRLLLHKSEILTLYGKVKKEGFTLIPLSVYLKGSLVKVSLGLCRGKKLYDKREDAANKDAKRDIERAVKERNKLE
jgi:SsrA-binding protein